MTRVHPPPNAAAQAADCLLIDLSAGVATLTLNRPQQRNAMSRELRRRLVGALQQIARDPDVHVVVLTGAGQQGFCVGLDLDEIESGVLPVDEIGPASPLMQAFAAMPQPIIGAINGFAITGGLELALQCDLLIASSRACFADTHARVGLVSGWGLSQRLTARVGATRASYMHLTGSFIDSATAKDWGLVLEVVPPDYLAGRCASMAETIAGCEPAALRGMVRAVRFAAHAGLAEGLALERDLALASMQAFDATGFHARRLALQQRGRRATGAV